MKKEKLIIVIVVAIVFVFVGFQYYPSLTNLVNKTGESIGNTTVEVASISEEVSSGRALLFDVRTSEEIAETGYAKNAVHFDVARLESGELPQVPKDTRIYTYCKSGNRAEKAKVILEENGYTNVVNIGSLNDWISSGGGIITK